LIGKKTGSQIMIMQIHMQMPDIMRLAKAYFDALDAFAEGKPIGDGIGPLVVTRFAREYGGTPDSYVHEISREVGYYPIEVEGRTVYALRATGPGGTVGKPGFAVKKLVDENKGKIARIITIDAALKLEGEDMGRVSEGTGAAIGDERIKTSILKRTKPGDKIILAGIGNTIGIGL
jgi:hypothetical protein